MFVDSLGFVTVNMWDFHMLCAESVLSKEAVAGHRAQHVAAGESVLSMGFPGLSVAELCTGWRVLPPVSWMLRAVITCTSRKDYPISSAAQQI